MDVLFLCGIYPQAHKDKIFKNSKKGYQFAAQNLQEAIVDGFIQNNVDLSIVTMPFLSTFPLGYKKPIVKYKRSKFMGIVDTKCASFINIPFLQKVANTAEKDVYSWCRSKGSGIRHIVVYSLTVNLIEIALRAKRDFENIRISVIIPDLPEFMGSNYLVRALGIKKRQITYLYKNISFFDRFILLSEAMALPLNIENRKFAVVEGIFNSVDNMIRGYPLEDNTKVILYTGALSHKYGIQTLIDAFSLLLNPQYRLIICGDGDAKEFVRNAADNDSRINYMGQVSYESILMLQKSADLLVNPRTPEGDYTRFSFPSKTMEYLASGTPMLMYKLPGVPPEYFEYCYTMDEMGKNALAYKMNEILCLPHEESKKRSEAAVDFILKYKNSKSQVNKIIKLIAEN